MCSFIVHLHLNRSPCSLILSYPKQPIKAAFLLFGGLVGLGEAVENIRKGVVDIKRGFVLDFGVYKRLIELDRNLVGLLAQLGSVFADQVSIKIDSGNPLHVALVRHLVAVGVETVTVAAVLGNHLRAANISHSAKDGGDVMAVVVEAGLCIEVDVQLGLSVMDSGKEALPLSQKIHHHPDDIVDPVGVFRGSSFYDFLVFGTLHDLLAKIGALGFGGVPVVRENVAAFIEKALQLVLVPESFFQMK